jgi:hypothetical protein
MLWKLIAYACNLLRKARESLYFVCRPACGAVLAHINTLEPNTGLRSGSIPTRLHYSRCS